MRAGKDHFRNEDGDAHLNKDSIVEEEFDDEDDDEQAVIEQAAVEQDDDEEPAIPDYTKYPREFITYRWYRPIITSALFVVIYIGFCVALLIGVSHWQGGDLSAVFEMIKGGYDSFDAYTTLGAIVSLGNVALMIPALAIANKIAGGRTFKSYGSSRGGWSFGIFFKCLLLAFLFVAIPVAVDEIFFEQGSGVFRFTKEGLILLTILGPMQCIAEEYVFRGLLLQTFGSWFRFPPLAILLSSAAFAGMHPYNRLGVIDVFITGLTFCIITWLSHGIEASSAMHIANNMAIFYCVGAGYGEIGTNVDQRSLIFSAAISAVFLIVIIFCKVFGMFEVRKKNDAEKWNAKVEAKRAKKAAQQGIPAE